MFEFWNFWLVDKVCKGPSLWNSGISDELYFFRQNKILVWGEKHTALFQTHNWECQVFSTRFLRGYTQIPDTGQIGSKLFSSFLNITILLFWSKFGESAGVEKYFDRTRTLLKVFPASSFSRSCKLSFWWFKLGGYPFGWRNNCKSLPSIFQPLKR